MNRILSICTCVFLLSGCRYSVRTNNNLESSGMHLAEADYEVLDWVDSTACASYVFFFRFPERDDEEKGGKRVGVISRGSVLGSNGPPDADSADALYGALVKMPKRVRALPPLATLPAHVTIGFERFG